MLTWLLIGFLIVFSGWDWYMQKLRSKELKHPSDLLNKRYLARPLLGLSIILIPIIVVNFIFPERNELDAKTMIERGKRAEHGNLFIRGFESLMQQDSTNPAAHFDYIDAVLGISRNKVPAGAMRREVIKRYRKLYLSGGLHGNSVGTTGLIYAYIQSDSLGKARDLLLLKFKAQQPYFNFLQGKVHEKMFLVGDAERFYQQEIAVGTYFKGPVQALSQLYLAADQRDSLRTILEASNLYPHVPIRARWQFYYEDGNVGAYVRTLFEYVASKFYWLGGLAALLVTLAWLFYIVRLDVFEKERWTTVLLVFLLGTVFTYLVFPISNFFNFSLAFNINGDPINDFLYCTFVIGGPEELVKILPLLLLLRFSKAVNEPYDYILYASVAALGFAFSENLIYYQSYSLENISARSLMSVVGHMFDTSLIAYGIMLNKYKLKRNPILNFLGFYFLAMLAHGFYDFWLINGWGKQFSFLTTLFFLASVHLWVILKNNALNNSPYYDPSVKINNQAIQWGLILSLIGIQMLEYVAIGGIYSRDLANKGLISGAIFTSFFIAYLSTNFSRFELIRGYWKPVRLPWQFLNRSQRPAKSHVGQKIKLYNTPTNKTPLAGLPISGEVIEQKLIDGTSDWFLVKLERQLYVQQVQKNYLLVQTIYATKDLDTSNAPINVLLIPDRTNVLSGSLEKQQFIEAGAFVSVAQNEN